MHVDRNKCMPLDFPYLIVMAAWLIYCQVLLAQFLTLLNYSKHIYPPSRVTYGLYLELEST
jgi:hypothetical protein